MDIILVNSKARNSSSLFPPLGLGYIAGYLREQGFDPWLYDFQIAQDQGRSLMREVCREDVRLIGFGVDSINFLAVKKLITEVRAVRPSIRIVVGGPHVSALPEYSLTALQADYAIVGEGEKVVGEIMKSLCGGTVSLTQLSGIYELTQGQIRSRGGCAIIDDLAILPFPAWDLMLPSQYPDTAGHLFSKRSPVAPVITSRGCPHHCSFCSSRLIHGNKLRMRKPEQVVGEIEHLVKAYGVREINICDDTFTENRSHAIKICESISRAGLDITWRTPVGVRLDTLDEDLVRVMRISGCYQLGFGIESFSGDILRENAKPLTKSKIVETIRMVKKSGIETFGFFIFGLPGETEETARQTLQFIKNSELDYVWITYAVPLPGTILFNSLYGDTDLASIPWDTFHFNMPFETCSLPKRKLQRYFFEGFLIAYSNPRRFVRIIRNLRFRSLRKLGIFLVRVLKNNFLSLIEGKEA